LLSLSLENVNYLFISLLNSVTLYWLHWYNYRRRSKFISL